MNFKLLLCIIIWLGLIPDLSAAACIGNAYGVPPMPNGTFAMAAESGPVTLGASTSLPVEPSNAPIVGQMSCEGANNVCIGDVTHYDGGLGACGWTVNTKTDMQIALPEGFMGARSNDNPYCGRRLVIRNPQTGNTVSAQVGDKCTGCEGRSIDLTDVLFQIIVPQGDGRVSGIEWWFT